MRTQIDLDATTSYYPCMNEYMPGTSASPDEASPIAQDFNPVEMEAHMSDFAGNIGALMKAYTNGELDNEHAAQFQEILGRMGALTEEIKAFLKEDGERAS